MKSAFCALVGRPSSGKSTLINALCGQKVSIVSPVPQTTRNQVRGIVNAPEGQIVFLDTPGFHESEKKFNILMMETVKKSLESADVVLYLLDSTRAPGPEEQALVDTLAHCGKPIVVGLNKQEVSPNVKDELEEFIKKNLPDLKALLHLSALGKQGIEPILKRIFELSPEGQPFYPEEYYTDQEGEFRVAEIIREAAMNRVSEEIPHALYVEVADLETRKDGQELWIRAFLTVDRESQVGILVGQGGAKIKEIRQASQRELGKIFTQRIQLDLRVKVNSKWRTKDSLIKNLLQKEDEN